MFYQENQLNLSEFACIVERCLLSALNHWMLRDGQDSFIRIPDSTAKLNFNFKLSPLLRAIIAEHHKACVCPHCLSSYRNEVHDAERAQETEMIAQHNHKKSSEMIDTHLEHKDIVPSALQEVQ